MIRAALPPDTPRVLPLVEAAFAVWVPRLGRKTPPVEDDYERRAAAQQFWVRACWWCRAPVPMKMSGERVSQSARNKACSRITRLTGLACSISWPGQRRPTPWPTRTSRWIPRDQWKTWLPTPWRGWLGSMNQRRMVQHERSPLSCWICRLGPSMGVTPSCTTCSRLVFRACPSGTEMTTVVSDRAATG